MRKRCLLGGVGMLCEHHWLANNSPSLNPGPLSVVLSLTLHYISDRPPVHDLL